MSNKIKLLEIDNFEMTRRFQSQLYLGRNVADFIMENNIMKYWTSGNFGLDFYPYLKEYEIVSTGSDMRMQVL